MFIFDAVNSVGQNVKLCDVAVMEITELFQVVVVAGMRGRDERGETAMPGCTGNIRSQSDLEK